MRRIPPAVAIAALLACSEQPPEKPPEQATPAPAAAVIAAPVPPGALTQVPWLLGTFRGVGEGSTEQAPFFERYSLADDSTLVVESFKDSTLTGAIDSTRYEARRDSLSNPGASRYIATVITPDSLVFAPLVGVTNGFAWKKGDDRSWIAVITPAQRVYRLTRIR